MMETGIYKITNLVDTNKIYIGRCQTAFEKRWKEHISQLNHDKHVNIELQADWNKYGAENFKFEIYKECTEIEAKYYELVSIDHFRQAGYHLYNVESFRDDIVLRVCNKLRKANIGFEIDKLDDRCKSKKNSKLHWQLYVKNGQTETYVHLYNQKIYALNQNLQKLNENIQIRHNFINTYELNTIDKDISVADASNSNTIADELYDEVFMYTWLYC